MRTGIGYDSHRFQKGRRLVLGGVDIPHEAGLAGHSDADVLVHAIIDAILGAVGLGDIGTHFPDSDSEYKDASSIELLRRVLHLVQGDGYEVTWVDATVICEAPRIGPHVTAMREALEEAGLRHVNIKGKSNEGMGFTGRGEGIASIAVATVEHIKS
jgi:2-C-methyl-D-erythritol 2,4-cyclodiphosphate synthase